MKGKKKINEKYFEHLDKKKKPLYFIYTSFKFDTFLRVFLRIIIQQKKTRPPLHLNIRESWQKKNEVIPLINNKQTENKFKTWCLNLIYIGLNRVEIQFLFLH